MKGLWISLAATAALLLVWGIFISSAKADVDSMVTDIDEAIICAETEDWEKARDIIISVSDQWHARRTVFSAFFDESSIGGIEASLCITEAYIHAEEKGSSMAELANLRHLLLFLYENEMITIENIF